MIADEKGEWEKMDRVFGLHFDFHADDVHEIGMNTNAEDIEKYILDTKPYFIQCDCKGHPGYACYPTKVGTPAPGLKKDNLRVWADTAKKHGIPLFVHYSGVADARYVKDHPDQAEVDLGGGHYDNMSTSVFGDYTEKLLIPQLKEVIAEYGIAGAWIDGEVWAVHRDFSEMVRPYLWWNITPAQHGRIMRQGFFDYVRKYTEELHRFKPEFKVISNWLYSSYVPEKPEIDVDFLSGDFQPSDSAHFVRLESRVMALQGKPWDLMAWSFTSPHRMDKPAAQLCQEAAAVMTQGGGFSLYIPQNKDGSAKKYEGTRFREIAEFAHKRAFLYRKEPIAQIGVLFSADSFYEKNSCFKQEGETDRLIGALNLLLEAGYTANVMLEWQLESIDQYEAVVVPEWAYIREENKKKLIHYAKKGGNLILIGVECCRQFAELLGETGAVLEKEQVFLRDKNGCIASVKRPSERTVPLFWLESGAEEANAKCLLTEKTETSEKRMLAYRTDLVEKGRIAWIPFDLGSLYAQVRGFCYQHYMEMVLDAMCEKLVKTEQQIDVTMQKAEQGVYLNLINMRQERHSLQYEVFEHVPPMEQVEVTINREYRSVLAPLGESFSWRTENGKTVIVLDKLEIHTVFLLQE